MSNLSELDKKIITNLFNANEYYEDAFNSVEPLFHSGDYSLLDTVKHLLLPSNIPIRTTSVNNLHEYNMHEEIWFNGPYFAINIGGYPDDTIILQIFEMLQERLTK